MYESKAVAGPLLLQGKRKGKGGQMLRERGVEMSVVKGREGGGRIHRTSAKERRWIYTLCHPPTRDGGLVFAKLS